MFNKLQGLRGSLTEECLLFHKSTPNLLDLRNPKRLCLGSLARAIGHVCQTYCLLTLTGQLHQLNESFGCAIFVETQFHGLHGFKLAIVRIVSIRS